MSGFSEHLSEVRAKGGMDTSLGCLEMASSVDMVILSMSSPWGGYSQRDLLSQGEKSMEKLIQSMMGFHFLSQGMPRMT